SIELLTKAQTINSKTDDPFNLLILNELGRVYTRADSAEEAFGNYTKLLQLARTSRQEKREADALFYLGVLHMRAHAYDSAMVLHKKALQIKRKFRDRSGEVTSLNTIGDLYLAMKNDERALANYV